MQSDPSFFETEINSSKPIYFIHPHNKFWEVSVQAQNVTYRAGKMKNNAEITSQKLLKRYSSDYVAKRTVKQKIREKLVKAYIVFQGSKPEQSTVKPQDFQLINSAPKPKLTEKLTKAVVDDEKILKKQQKEQKKKLKNVMQQLQERNKQITENPSTSFSIEQGVQNEPIVLEKSVTADKKDSTYLVNSKTGEAIDYELMTDNKIKITKFFHDKSCGFEIKSFGSKEQTMKFLFGERQWLKSQAYEERQKPTQKADTISSEHQPSKQSLTQGQSLNKKKKKPKPAVSLLVLTNVSLHFPNLNILITNLPTTKAWKEGTDPKGWLISQKLDGVRCHWSGTEMFSRNGNKFVFPNFFVKNWPKAQLDGELFNGRGKFKHTISCVKRLKPDFQLWANVRFLVFDAPGLKCSFKQRYRIMKEVIEKTDNPYIKCHFHRQCKGFKDMFNQLDQINQEEGQGIMLRDPNSLYEFKRSKALLKVKTFHDDEATIVGYNEGTGKFVGHIGSLKCVNSLGAHFDVGSGLNDEMRYNPPKIGQRLVYKYQELNKETGRPRFPTFLRLFEDETAAEGESVMGWVKEGQNDDYE